jgi:GDP-L-fucose synthase
MNKDAKIAILGAAGLVGKSITNYLVNNGYTNLLPVTRKDVDLKAQEAVDYWFAVNRPEYIILAAAKVGGILNNSKHPADFGYENGIIQMNVLSCSHKYNVKKLLFLGSACIYPKETPQPIKEEYLLSNYLEPTNEMYALAKVYGLKLCQAYKKQYGCNFISCMPSNLYGVFDNFSVNGGHVIPANVRKFHAAKLANDPVVTCFGTGQVYREFLYAEDLAEACVFLMNEYNDLETINIGYGDDITIFDLMNLISKVVGYTGRVEWDTTKPNGVTKRLLDSSKIHKLGWKAKVPLEEGLIRTYKWYTTSPEVRV